MLKLRGYNARQNQEDPDTEHAMGAGVRGHHSVSVTKRGLGSIDVCQLSVMVTPRRPPGKQLCPPTLGQVDFLGKLERIRGSPGGLAGKKNRQLIHKVLRDK